MTDETTAPAPADDLPAGAIKVGDDVFMRDSSSRLVPIDMVKPVDKLMDQTVRTMIDHAKALSAQIGRFKGHSFDDVGAFEALIAAEYDAKVGGQKGNLTLTTVDACFKIQIQVQDQIVFGPELQAAKALVDECVADWAAGARSEIRMLVEHAFQVDKEGRINRAALFQLRRVAIDDERWRNAMDAITDSIRIVGSKTYMRFYERDNAREKWAPITIDMAAA